MMIYGGIAQGCVLQRNAENIAYVELSGEFFGQLRAEPGLVINENEKYYLTDIPVGGPYTVTLFDDNTTAVFSDVYVGDVWLLAGQSNMEGAGRLTVEDKAYAKSPDHSVRTLFMNDMWAPAAHPLHRLAISPDKTHKALVDEILKNRVINHQTINDDYPNEPNRCVGPGLAFARRMHELTGIPQGIIPCAVGGSCMDAWMPIEGVENFFDAAVRRLVLAGKRIRGLFWYQGEADVADETRTSYANRFETMRRRFAEICSMDVLPAVQVQLFHHTLPNCLEPSENRCWSAFRQMQSGMDTILPQLVTVASNDLELDDMIHLSSASHQRLGARAAMAMAHLIFGMGYDEPMLEKITAEPDEVYDKWTVLTLHYSNVAGKLASAGAPCGFKLSETEDGFPSWMYIQHMDLGENTIRIRIELSVEQLHSRCLWYGYGHDTVCNITDSLDRAIPSFGPFSLANI